MWCKERARQKPHVLDQVWIFTGYLPRILPCTPNQIFNFYCIIQRMIFEIISAIIFCKLESRDVFFCLYTVPQQRRHLRLQYDNAVKKNTHTKKEMLSFNIVYCTVCLRLTDCKIYFSVHSKNLRSSSPNQHEEKRNALDNEFSTFSSYILKNVFVGGLYLMSLPSLTL